MNPKYGSLIPTSRLLDGKPKTIYLIRRNASAAANAFTPVRTGTITVARRSTSFPAPLITMEPPV
jgi:hypothetical protein